MAVGGSVDAASTTNGGTTFTQAHREHFAAFRSKNFGALDGLTIDTATGPARSRCTRTASTSVGRSRGWSADRSEDRSISRVAAFNLKKVGDDHPHLVTRDEGGSVYDLDTLPDGAVVPGGTFASLTRGRVHPGKG
jgi:hypothetical protein